MTKAPNDDFLIEHVSRVLGLLPPDGDPDLDVLKGSKKIWGKKMEEDFCAGDFFALHFFAPFVSEKCSDRSWHCGAKMMIG